MAKKVRRLEDGTLLIPETGRTLDIKKVAWLEGQEFKRVGMSDEEVEAEVARRKGDFYVVDEGELVQILREGKLVSCVPMVGPGCDLKKEYVNHQSAREMLEQYERDGIECALSPVHGEVNYAYVFVFGDFEG